MSHLVKDILRGWHCLTCGRNWAPGIVACPLCAEKFTKDERIQFLERYGYRKRIDKLNKTLAKVGV